MIRIVFRFLILFVIWAAVAIPPWKAQSQLSRSLVNFSKETISIASKTKIHRFEVELALTPKQQMQGLMFRRKMGANVGMLFVHLRETPIKMWMKNTYLPLDMLFIARGGRVVKIAERTVPLSDQTIASGMPVIAVLELNSGTVSRLGIKLGDKVIATSLGTAH